MSEKTQPAEKATDKATPRGADKLDIAHATLPQGFTLEALPVN